MTAQKMLFFTARLYVFVVPSHPRPPRPASHYYAYYKQQVALSKASGDAPKPAAPPPPPPPGIAAAQRAAATAAAVPAEKPSEPPVTPAAEPQRRLEPPRELHFTLTLPPSLTAREYDTVRLAASFVAVNGPAFNQALYVRESDDASFGFLVHEAHPHRALFLQLVNQYARVLQQVGHVPEAGWDDRATLLEHVVRRTEWERNVRAQKAAEVRNAKSGGDEVSQAVDWDDFVVVQLIDLNDDVATLAAPLTLADLKLAAEPARQQQPAPGAVRVASGQQHPLPEQQQQQPPPLEDERPAEVELPSRMAGAKVVQHYVPGGAVAGKALETHQRCPICSQLVPIEDMEQHMKVETMSKKHLQTLKETAMGRKSAMAPDDEIASAIADFSKVRTGESAGRGQELRGRGVAHAVFRFIRVGRRAAGRPD